LGVVSFYIDGLHYNLGVKLLNDYFGVQVRGGCACAGPYGHCLLNIGEEVSNEIASQIDQGNLSMKPGWIRLSIHPILKDEEIHQAVAAIEAVAKNYLNWQQYYEYNAATNEFESKLFNEHQSHAERIDKWFEV
jgi:selenocysteine lyase/cysteine desulfurase